MLLTVYPILLVSGWFTVASVLDALKIFLFFAFVGLVIWAVMLALAKVFDW